MAAYSEKKKRDEHEEEKRLKKKLRDLQAQHVAMEKKMVGGVKQIIKKQFKEKRRYGEEGQKIGENEYLTQQRHPYTGAVRQIIVRYDDRGKRVPPPMVNLPDHLRPPRVANIAGSYQDADRLHDPILAAAEHQQQFASLKNNNIRKIDQKREDQARHAEFLNELFQEDFNDEAIDQDQYEARLAREQRYQEAKDGIVNDDEMKRNLEQNFKLPKFNEDEDPK